MPFGPASNLTFPWLPPCLPEAPMSTAPLPLFLLHKRKYVPIELERYYLIYLLSHIWPVTLARSSGEKSQGSGSSQLHSTHLLPTGMWTGVSRERTVLSIVCRADVGYTGFPLPGIPCCCPAILGQVLFKTAHPKSLPFAISSLWTSWMALPGYSHQQRFKIKIWAYHWLPRTTITGNIAVIHT